MPTSVQSIATVQDALTQAIERAGRFSSNAEIPPMAILWPDGEVQWREVVANLRQSLPILTLGDYDEAAHTGPAIWIRAHLATRRPDVPMPIVYLPGIRKDVFRNIEDAPEEIQPLLYLQYRGTMFLQTNGKDWTLPAFFQNAQQGLGIRVDGSEATRTALIATAPALLRYPVEQLRAKPGGLAADDLYDIIVSDMPKRILQWLDDADGARAMMDAAAWDAFSRRMQLTYKLDPEKDGPIAGARMLGRADFASPWMEVWRRFAENPLAYRRIPDLLRGAKPAIVKQRSLFDAADADHRWPQDNEEQEKDLQRALLGLETQTGDQARTAILELETVHGPRRASVWATLGRTPLAFALQHLATLSSTTKIPFPAGSAASLIEHYTGDGWKVDAAVLDAWTSVTRKEDVEAIMVALHAIYRPWLWTAAERFQEAMEGQLPQEVPSPRSVPGGTVILFADGLRYDLAARMAQAMCALGMDAGISARVGPTPGITSSAKRAQTPVADLLAPGPGFNVVVNESGTTLSQTSLRKLMAQRGWQVLDASDTGTPGADQRAWTEQGEIDSYGHSHPRDLPKHARTEVQRIRARVQELLDAGWSRIEIVTDHGWLLTPQPMPKTDLPAHLSSDKKGRCARLNPGASTSVQTVPWCWDPSVQIAMAPGASCFEEGKRYEHGGLSPQESIIPTVTVVASSGKMFHRHAFVTITHTSWRGLRCSVDVSGDDEGLSIDIRQRAGDATTSLAATVKLVDEGAARVVVEDDIYEGQPAVIVVLDASGTVVAQRDTVVGEEA